MKELWKPVVGFEHYSISSSGRLRNPFGKLMHFGVNCKGNKLSNNNIIFKYE